MPTTPPGIQYLFSVLLPALGTPTVTIVFTRAILSRFYAVDLPRWTIAPLVGLWILASLLSRLASEYFKQRRECAELGAVLVPKAIPKVIGGINAASVMRKNSKSGYMGDFLEPRLKSYGPTFILTSFFQDRIFTVAPEIIKTVLATDFNNFEKGAAQKSVFQSVLGDGVFNADGDMWKFHRSMTRPFFSKDRISHFEMFGRHADDAIGQMRARLRTGHPVDFQDLVSRFTLDSATEFLFGNCVHSLSAGLPYAPNYPPALGTAMSSSCDPNNVGHPANVFAKAFAEVQTIIAQRAPVMTAWPLLEFWKDETLERMNVIAKFVDPILTEAIVKEGARGDGEKLEENGKNHEIEEDVTLLDHLVRTTKDAKILKDEILNIMIAGRDTTAALLTFAVYLLAQHPSVLKRLREEIITHMGSSRHPTFEDLRELKYLRAVINETLRLFPAVPFNSRVARQATTLPNNTAGGKPYYVPAGRKVTYSTFLMHRRTDLWGPDAAEFDPDRFLDERLQKYLTRNPFIFLPFNAGPRICPGQQFAYNESSYMLVRLLQSFKEIDLAPDAQPAETHPPAEWAQAEVGTRKRIEKCWPVSHLTIYAKGGLWVRMREATDGQEGLN